MRYDNNNAEAAYVLAARHGIEWLSDDGKKLAAVHARILMDAHQLDTDPTAWNTASDVYFAVRADAGNPFGFGESIAEYATDLRGSGYIELN